MRRTNARSVPACPPRILGVGDTTLGAHPSNPLIWHPGFRVSAGTPPLPASPVEHLLQSPRFRGAGVG